MAKQKNAIPDDPFGELTGGTNQPRKTPEQRELPPKRSTAGPRGGTTTIYKNEKTGTELARMTVYLEPDLQRAVKQAALDQGVSVNAWVQDAINQKLEINKR